jgi:hypothetical protein
MRIVLIALLIFILNALTYGQEPDGPTTLGNTITRKQVLELPRRDSAPKLTLQRALKIAETFIKKKRLDISSRYLFEAKWVSYDTNPETGAWHFWWVSTRHTKTDVRIAVSLDGKPTLLPLPGAT